METYLTCFMAGLLIWWVALIMLYWRLSGLTPCIERNENQCLFTFFFSRFGCDNLQCDAFITKINVSQEE